MYSTLDPDQPLSGRTRQYAQYEAGSPEPAQPNDLTLGIPALLGIFFAIVIVCGLAFGFGYSFGHHGPKPKPVSAAPAPAIPTTPPPLEAAAQPVKTAQPVGTAAGPEVSGAAKPSPAAALAVQETASPTGSASLSPAEHAALAAATSSHPTAASGPPTMVQIAAVMHPADAEALAGALRREGYNALVRTEPTDHFLHVQVGPFTTRESALAMRTRLQAKGYTPILKP